MHSLLSLSAFLEGQQSTSSQAEAHEYLRTAVLDKDLELKILQAVDELDSDGYDPSEVPRITRVALRLLRQRLTKFPGTRGAQEMLYNNVWSFASLQVGPYEYRKEKESGVTRSRSH